MTVATLKEATAALDRTSRQLLAEAMGHIAGLVLSGTDGASGRELLDRYEQLIAERSRVLDEAIAEINGRIRPAATVGQKGTDAP